MLWAIFGLLLVLTALAYFFSDVVETWIPGWKHTVVGAFTTIAGGLGSLATLLQGQDGAIAILLKNRPELVPLVSLGLGLLILVLGWVTPRAE